MRKLTEVLANNEKLVCAKREIVSEINADVYDNLTSLGIIDETSTTKQNISFSHNILLDYSIAKFLLNENVQIQIEYIKDNEKMAFIFRQSFIYFYTHLFKSEKQIFWAHYFKILEQNTPLFRLFHQTILNYVLVTLYESPEVLISGLENEKNEEKRGDLIRKILDAIRFITREEIRSKDVELFFRLSSDIHWHFLWIFGYLIEKGIKNFADNTDFERKLSIASSNYLLYILDNRNATAYKTFFDGNGGHFGVQNVCRTFTNNKATNKILIKRVLTILEEVDFPIDYFSTLSREILHIYTVDKTLGVYIYKTLYLKQEESHKETTWGSSVVMGLRSNRNQDYNHIHYILEEAFEKMLESDFEAIASVGIYIVNKSSSYNRWTGNKNMYERTLKVGFITTRLRPDFDYDIEPDESGNFSFNKKIFDFIEKNIENKSSLKKGKQQLLFTIKLIRAGQLWKRLLLLLTKYPQQFKSLSSQLLLNPAIYTCSATSYEAGQLLKTTVPFLTTAQKLRIEKNILSLKTVLGKPDAYLHDRDIAIYLNCIPAQELRVEESKEYLEKYAQIENIPNRRGLVMASVSAISNEELIRHAGFDTANLEDMKLYAQFEKIEKFNSLFQGNNELPQRESYKKLIPIVESFFIQSTKMTYASERLQFTCDHEIAKFVNILARLECNLNNDEKKLIEKIAKFMINSALYRDKEYEQGNLKDHSRIIHLSPKNAATQALTKLMYAFKQPDIEVLLLNLMNDNNSTVRFYALRALPYFWHFQHNSFWEKIEERITIEIDSKCLLEIIGQFPYNDFIEKDQQKVENALIVLIKILRQNEKEVDKDIWTSFTVVFLKLILGVNSSAAIKIIEENNDIEDFSDSLTFKIIRNVLDPFRPENNYDQDPLKYQVLIDVLLLIISLRFDSLKVNEINTERAIEDFKILDHIIQHLYFSITEKYNKKSLNIDAKRAFYKKIEPILDMVVEKSVEIESGFMIAHTGYYFMQLLNEVLEIDPEKILYFSNRIVCFAAKSGFTYDQSTLGEIVKFTERIIADYKYMLYKNENFNSLIIILDMFANSGWQEALELTWRLKEAF